MECEMTIDKKIVKTALIEKMSGIVKYKTLMKFSDFYQQQW